MNPVAIHLHKASRKLEVRFADGQAFVLDAEYLRVHSPSAEVRGHGVGQEVLVFGKKAVGINTLEPIGQYAVKIVFDDGHDSGLYTWQYLYELGSEYEQKWQAYLLRLQQAGQSREPVQEPLFKPL
ncbi:MAG: gamma-butyrobetaine hydroxylase-like domain-containing protein [Pseudomonadota bacterium]